VSGEVLPFRRRPGLETQVEALLFASGEPVSVRDLCLAIGGVVSPPDVRDALTALGQRFADVDGVVLVCVGQRWQLRTHPRHADAVARLRGVRPQTLSRAALETLSVVAYQQPATKGDVEKVRGVDSGGVLKKLLERGLIKVAGRRDVPGRPIEYATTRNFLDVFSLRSLGDLPTLEEREEL
jgi:segregation and condensation protein B